MPPPRPRGSFTGRLYRSLENPLSLLHHSDSDFFILGATGNVYTVTLSTTPSCTCPDPMTPCKHILFVYIRVLSLPIHDPRLRRHTLRPSHLFCLLNTTVSPDSFASATLRKRFHELYKDEDEEEDEDEDEAENENVNWNGSTCPVCLEEMGRNDGLRVLACATCKNPIHESCLMAWKDERSRTCVMCRARWREIGAQELEQGKYINLSAYIGEGDNMANVNHGQEN